MTGIVLAGGESRRMGADKAFLPFAGKPLVARVLDAVRRACGTVILVVHSPDGFADLGAVVVTDALEERGPLTGIYSGLLRSEDEYNFVAACDMPFLLPQLISHLESVSPGHDITVPRVRGMLEPLHAVYRRSLLPTIEERLRSGRKDVRGLLDGARVRIVTEEEIGRFDPVFRSFENVNTRREYEEAVCSDWECRSC